MLKLTTDKHKASRGLSATAELLVICLLMTCAKNYKNWWMHVKAIASQTWVILRHSVAYTSTE